MKRSVVVGNWKMNHTVLDAIRAATALKKSLSGKQEVEVIVAPNAVALSPVCMALSDVQVGVAAQNIHWEDFGAFTGEISAPMVADAGCQYVILGHSERRRDFAESNESIHRKVKAAIEHGLVPIVCVGESEIEKNQGVTEEVVARQLAEIFNGVTVTDSAELILAYEPVWAIGSGNSATSEQAQAVHAFIRMQMIHLLGHGASGEALADQMRILYGGSVTAENAGSFLKEKDIDGLLVGSASLDPSEFANIVTRSEDFSS